MMDKLEDGSNRNIIVIPARIGSTRFPRKPLALISGVPMLERVWRIAASVVGSEQVYIATDSQEISDAVKSFQKGQEASPQVVMTDESCATGSDRVYQAVLRIADKLEVPKAELRIIGFQGDAPLTPPSVLSSLFQAFDERPELTAVTAALELTGEALEKTIKDKSQGSSSGTLVVFDSEGKALYFSKALIPFARDNNPREVFKHIGIYAWRWSELEHFVSLPKGRLEEVESLEQLRVLENGRSMHVVEVDLAGRTLVSVDRPEDLEHAEAVIKEEGELF